MKATRVVLIFGLWCLLGGGTLASTSPFEEFRSVQKDYFSRLDFRIDSDQVALIPQFAANLSDIADQARVRLSNGKISNVEQRNEAGLIFIYDALMTLNNIHAVMEGLLSLDHLKFARRFAGVHGSRQEELVSRAQYAASELIAAADLRRDDRRIDSWLVAVKTTMEHIQTGQISNTSLSAVLDTIDVRPTFNLWTAILILNGHDASSELFTRLVAASKGFVDSSGSGNGPCALHPQDCRNGIRAPFNTQASVVVLGDVFLRKANQLIKAGDIGSGVRLASYANETFQQLFKPEHLQHTQKWPDRNGLVVRQETVAKLLTAQPVKDESLVSSDDFQRIYECSSCHGRATK